MSGSAPVTRAADSRAESTSGRALGLWTCVALVAGNMIGSGIFLLPASLAPYGGISIVGWLITAADDGRTFGYSCASHAVCCNMRGSVRVGNSAPPAPPGYE